MEQEKLIEKLKETQESIRASRSMVDDRASGSAAQKQIIQSQSLLLDCLVGLVQVGILEPEPDTEPEIEAEEEDEFSVESLQAVYHEPAKKKAAKKAAKARK